MKRLIIGAAIVGVVIFIAYQFLFADRRSRLKVDPNRVEAASVSYGPTTKSSRLLVREGRMSFTVENAMQIRDDIHKLVTGFDGYVNSEKQVDERDGRYYHQTVHIPTASLDEFMTAIEKLSVKIESKSSSATDVTEEVIDTKSRLKTKRRMETRFLEIIKQAKTVKDILEIESQIGAVRTEIESIEARVNFLQKQTSFASLNLSFHENTVSTRVTFASELVTSLNNGWTGLLSVITTIATIWPLLIVATLTVWIYFRRKRNLVVPAS